MYRFAVEQKRKRRTKVIRMLIGVALSLIIVLLQAEKWPIVEANSSETGVVLSDDTQMRQWLTDKLGVREGMFTFRYKGDTETLSDRLSEQLMTALYSDPFIRYNVSQYSFQWKGSDQAALVTVYVNYRETFEQYQSVRTEAKRIVNEQLPKGLDAAEQVRWLHDYVVLHVTYDEGLTHYTAYDAIYSGTTVCQGYALWLQALLEEAGIPSLVVEGTAGGTLHAWNMVQVDGYWYHVDATWNDPVTNEEDEVQYEYFMLSDAEMRQDHEWDELKTPRADQWYFLDIQ